METIEGSLVCDWITERHSVALRSGDLKITYEELDRSAGRFAGHLSRLGIGPHGTVAICMERSFDWIVAAIAIMRVGAAYVPLDSDWPEARLRFALENSGATALVARADTLNRIGAGLHGIDPRRDARAIACAPHFAPRPVDPASLAYIIYTSGSTGVPKGVEITHANLANLISWHQEAFAVTRSDRASHLAGLGFDAAVWEIWPYLAAGATLCLADESIRSSPELIQKWMVQEGITIGFVPTVHAAPLMGMNWPRSTELRYLLTGGDALHRAPSIPLPFQVVNNYGPTECTVVSTSTIVQPGSAGAPPIGRPITGAHVYLLDETLTPVPDGQVGEIFIGGANVGRGYRNLPELTERAFLPDPFSEVPGARMYRSGDRAVRRPDGQIEFRGRNDRQAKVRGHRIELDEIASALGQYAGLAFATATVDVDPSGENRLVAYVLPADGAPVPTAHDLQDHLLRTLPHYMVPAIFVRLSELPLSASGKVDLARLPSAAAAPKLDHGFSRKAGTPTEEKLLALVQSLLNNDAITAEDNFFLAGGHSLLGMQLIMRVRSSFGVDLSLRQLFEAPAVEHLAHLVEAKLTQDRLTAIWKELLGLAQIEPDATLTTLGADDAFVARLQRRIVAEFGRHVTKLELIQHPTIREQAELMHGSLHNKLAFPAGVVAMQPEGTRDPLFWLHYPCVTLAKTLGEDRPFLFVTLTDDDVSTLGDAPTLQSIGACFAARIVAAQPTGPIALGGFCLGGILSYEVAAQLQASGREVSDLVLLDTPSPSFYGKPVESLAVSNRAVYFAKKFAELGPRASFTKLLEYVSNRLTIRKERKLAPKEGEPVQLMIEAAASRYEPSVFDGPVSLIMASGNAPHVNFLPWWQALLPRTPHTEYVESHHLGLTEAPAVHNVAAAINLRLDYAEQERLLAEAGKSHVCTAAATVPAREEIEEEEEEHTSGWRIGVSSMQSPISAAAPKCS
jgi:amino acid adenylation domain-containing protein